MHAFLFEPFLGSMKVYAADTAKAEQTRGKRPTAVLQVRFRKIVLPPFGTL